MTTVSLPPPPPPPPVSEHQDLAVMLRQICFLNTVQQNRMAGMSEHQAISAAILAWADAQV